jgi:hypothetical protein
MHMAANISKWIAQKKLLIKAFKLQLQSCTLLLDLLRNWELSQDFPCSYQYRAPQWRSASIPSSQQPGNQAVARNHVGPGGEEPHRSRRRRGELDSEMHTRRRWSPSLPLLLLVHSWAPMEAVVPISSSTDQDLHHAMAPPWSSSNTDWSRRPGHPSSHRRHWCWRRSRWSRDMVESAARATTGARDGEHDSID